MACCGMQKKRVLFVFPNSWDVRQLGSCRPAWEDRFDIEFGELSVDDCPSDLDIVGYIDEMVQRYRGRIDGVASSSDYPGATVAAAIGSALGLNSPPPAAVMKTAHKYYSRLAQREAVPEATPDFWLIDARRCDDLPDLPYPVFVKPVKGAFSVHSRKVHNREELRQFLDRPAIRDFTEDYMAIFNRLVRETLQLEIDGHYFLAESFLHGVQVTVEGFVFDGEVSVYGIVDSVFHKDAGSFARFDYPSGLRPEVLADMKTIASRVIPATGLHNSHFNVEMIYDAATDEIRIIEINPRICGQFGDLYAKVDGTNSYRYALDVATGRPPAVTRGSGAYAMATSFPLRIFSPAQVLSAPAAQQIARAEALYSETLVWLECQTGDRLDDFSTWEDGTSARYAIINLGGQSRRELRQRLQALLDALAIRFAEI